MTKWLEERWDHDHICSKTSPDYDSTYITFFKGGPTHPFLQWKKASNNIQDPGYIGFLPTLNWSFVRRSSLHLLWLVLYKVVSPITEYLRCNRLEIENQIASLQWKGRAECVDSCKIFQKKIECFFYFLHWSNKNRCRASQPCVGTSSKQTGNHPLTNRMWSTINYRIC
jgi:hypothetical protein